MNIKLMAALAICLVPLGLRGIHAATIVSPAFAANLEGTTNNLNPFGTDPGRSVRFQQVYNASEFSTLGVSNFITQIAFRPDFNTFPVAPYTITLANVQIRFSTTSKSASNLSTTFGDNIGSDEIIAFSGPLTLSTGFVGPAGGPKAFDLVINLTTPFLFTRTNGNLLMDVRNFNGSNFGAAFDATGGLGVSARVTTNFAGNVNSTVANQADSIALVTRFITSPAVPEPNVIGLAMIGSLGLLATSRRARGQNV